MSVSEESSTLQEMQNLSDKEFFLKLLTMQQDADLLISQARNCMKLIDYLITNRFGPVQTSLKSDYIVMDSNTGEITVYNFVYEPYLDLGNRYRILKRDKMLFEEFLNRILKRDNLHMHIMK